MNSTGNKESREIKIPKRPKKQAPISIITGPNPIFVKTKLNNVAASYLGSDQMIHIRHGKKNSFIKQTTNLSTNQKFSHVKYKTNCLTNLDVSLGEPRGFNKTHNTIITPTTRLKNQEPKKRINVNDFKRRLSKNLKCPPEKKKSSSNNKSLYVGNIKKKVNTTFSKGVARKSTGKDLSNSTVQFPMTRENTDFQRKTESNIDNHCYGLHEMDILFNKINKVSSLKKNLSKNDGKKKILEIKTNFGSLANNNIKDKLRFVTIRHTTTNISHNLSKSKKLNSTRQDSKSKNSVGVSSPKPPSQKREEKKKNKLVKCPMKVNLLSLIQENKLKLKQAKEYFKAQDQSRDGIENILNGVNEEETAEIDDFDDLNSIVKKLNFYEIKTDSTSIFSAKNPLYEEYCKQFDEIFDKGNKFKNSAKRTLTNHSGSTRENSSKKTFVPFSVAKQ